MASRLTLTSGFFVVRSRTLTIPNIFCQTLALVKKSFPVTLPVPRRGFGAIF
jgi:hypothetical protein